MLYALLLLTSVAIPVPTLPAKPDFNIEIDDQSLPIVCAENPADVARLRAMRQVAEMEVRAFGAALNPQSMTLEDSEQLLARQLTLTKAYALLAIHLHAEHLCQHRDQWPRPTPKIGI